MSDDKDPTHGHNWMDGWLGLLHQANRPEFGLSVQTTAGFTVSACT